MEEKNTKVENKGKKIKVKNKKKLIISIICIVAIAIVLALIVIVINKNNIRVIKTATNDIDMTNTENVEIIDGKKVNNSEEMKMTQHVANLSCEITELTADEEKSKLTMVVRNETDEEFAGNKATIVFFEKEGRVFGELNTYIGKIAVNESITLDLTTTLDITNAYSYTVQMDEIEVEEDNKGELNV